VGIELDGTYTVTLETDVSYTFAGLILGGSSGTQTLSGDLNTLIINGNTTISPHGALNLVGSTIAGTGTVTNRSTVALQNTTVSATTAWSNQGTVYVHGTVTFNGIVVTAVGSAFLVQGQASTGNALLTVASGFTNNGVIDLLSSQESGAHMAVTNGTLINMAMISSAFGQDGGPRTLAAHLDNRGLLFVETPLTVNTPAAPLTNSGSIDLLQNLTVNGDFAQTATGLLSTRIGEGSQLSTLAVTGTAALGGTLHATLADGFVPVVENSFAPVFYEGVTGTFATFSLPALGAGLAWTTTVGGAQVNLRVDATTGSVVSWNNPAGGNWNNPSNWSPARVPTASDVAAITLSGDYTVTLDVSTEVAGLDLGSGTGVRTFTALSRILTVNGPINVFSGGVLSLTSSTLNGTGSLTNQGTVVLVHGTIQTILNNDGLLLAQGSSFLQNNVTTTQQSIIRAQGQNSTGDAFLTVAGGFFNLGVIELTSVTAASAARLAVTTGTLVNNEQALIRSFVGAGGERSLIAALDNLGVLHVDQPLVMNRASSQHSNSGLIDLTGADLTVAQSGSAPSFSNIGQITIGNNRTFTIAGGTFVQQAGATLNGAGTFIQNLGTATFNTGVTLVGLNLTAMTLNLGSGVNLSVSGPTVSLLSTTVNGPGIITIGAGQTLLMTGTNITASSALDNQGTVVVNGGSQVNGALLSSTGSVIRMQADATTNFAQMTVPNTGFVNNGAIELTSSVNAIAQLLANSGGTFTNGTSGTITTFGGAGGLRFLGAMNNQGTVTVRPGANSSGILHFSGNLTNSGVVNLEIGGTTAGDGHGQVTVNGTASLGGTLNVALVNGFVPAVNDVFTIMTCATSCAGGFTTLNLPALGTGLAWSPAVNATTVTLTVVATGGATVSWINPAGGLWSERTNWSTGVVPSSTDVVGITLAGTYGVNVDAAPTIAGLILGNATGNQTFGATSRVVTINGPISVVSGGQLHLTGSTLNGTGSVTNQGNIELINSTVTNIVDNQGVLIAYGSTTSLNNTITNTGTLRVLGHSIAGEANLTVLQGFTNNGMIDLNSVTGHSAQLTVTNGTLTNAIEGVIQSSVGAGGQRTIDAQLDNQGILDINLVLTLNRSTSAQHRNSGTIEINGNFTVGQSITGTTFTNTGNVTLSAGPVWTINGGTLDLAGGLVSGSPFSQVILNTATLAFTPARITAPLTLNSTAISGGAIVVGEGDVLTLEGGGTTAPITIANAGTLVIHRAVALTSIANIQNGGTLIVQGHGGFDAALTVANGFTNNGNIELTSATGHGASLTVTNGTLVNAAGANFVSSVGAGGTRVLAAQLQNAGVVDVQHALDISRAEADHENNGSIRLTDGNGNLTVTQSGSSPTFTNNGSMDLGAGRAVNISGGHLAFAEGAVTGTPTSTLIVNNAQLDFSATTTVPLTLTNTTISGGSLTILAGREVTLLGGGLTDPVNLAGGTLITGRTVTLTSLAISGGVLRVEGGHGGFPADLQVANPVVNNGQIQLTSSSGHASTLTVNGTLTNSSTGVINVLQGAGGGRTLAATLDNQGQINAGIALDINRVDARHVNTGTINFTLGIQTLTQTGTDPRFTNAGTIALTSNSVWNVSGGLFDVDQGIITGSSANNLQVTNAVIAFTPATIALPLTLVNTSVEAGAVTVASGQTLTLEGGAVPVPITVQNTGVLVAHRTLALTDVSTEPGGTLRVEGGSGSFPAAVTVANPVNNAGIIELTSLSGHDSRLDVSSGTLTNSGTILSDIGSGGARILGAELENQNLVSVRQPLALSRSGAAHRNFGTIDLTTADLTVAGAASFTNTSDGLVSLGADRRWTVSGGSLDLNSGIVTGPTSATLVLSGATLTYTVASLTLPISVHNGGNMSPNGLSILGLLNLNGSYSQTASGVLNIELRGTTLLEYDRVSIRENATLDGTLSVTTLNDFVPQVDDSFTILSAASISGNFGTTNLPPSAGIWQVNIGSTTVVITVTRP
jgi:fibronectin-binding autotransporter adhesin